MGTDEERGREEFLLVEMTVKGATDVGAREATGASGGATVAAVASSAYKDRALRTDSAVRQSALMYP